MKTAAICTVLSVVIGSSVAPGWAAQREDVTARLARAPKPWTQPMHRITRDEYEETLKFWAERHPQRAQLEQRAETAEKLPIYLLRISDRGVPDQDKQVCLITSLHGGPERSGTTTILHLAEWLLGDDPPAAEIRRRQIVLLMPIINPYAFFVTDRFGNSQGIDPYTAGAGQFWDLKTLTFTAGDKCPEVKAFLDVVDQYRPEVHADVHGIGLQEYPADRLGERRRYRGQVMFESSGSAYSNYALRPWDWRVVEAMATAAREAGFGSDRYEADGQRCFGSAAMEPIRDRFWPGQPMFYPTHYAYAKYHTMTLAMEVGWEASGVARLRGLLQLGNRVWEGEPVAGYPVDRVKPFVGHFLVARGASAEARRRSRAELWQRQDRFTHAILYPQTDGRDSYFVALTPAAAKYLDAEPEKFLAQLQPLSSPPATNAGGPQSQPAIDTAAIAAFLHDGPEIKLYIEPGKNTPVAACPPLEHGLALRLRIPYRKPELVDLRLNGHLLQERPTGGYQVWWADGYTQVQIDVPPEKVPRHELLLVTCAYAPDVQRNYGWTPPPEVRQRIQGRAAAAVGTPTSGTASPSRP